MRDLENNIKRNAESGRIRVFYIYNNTIATTQHTTYGTGGNIIV